MNIHYPGAALPRSLRKSIFLADPSPRDSDTQSWRPEAIQILRELGFDGEVFSPEPQTRVDSYIDQIEWERDRRQAADIVVFWIPRELKKLPGFTTNIEFGEDWPTFKILYGRPDSAPKNKYLDARWRALSGEEPMNDLRAILARAVAYLGEGALREGADAQVPLGVWSHPPFQRWHASVHDSGNRMTSFELVRVFPKSRTGATPETPIFAVIAKAGVWSRVDDRVKNNEFFVSRGDVSCIAAFWREKTPALADAVNEAATGELAPNLSDDPRTILIRESRQAVRNADGMIYELPGGSSPDLSLDPRSVAAEEFFEESGLRVDPERFIFVGERQLAAAILTHGANLFAVELTDEEAAFVDTMIRENRILGTGGHHIEGGHSEERITLVFPRLSELSDYPVDWSVMGMAHGAWAALRKETRRQPLAAAAAQAAEDSPLA